MADSGVLQRAQREDVRQAFLNYRKKEGIKTDKEYDEMAAYIQSPDCVRDLQKLIDGVYDMDPPFHFRIPKNFSGRKRDIYVFRGASKYMLSLINFVMRDHDDMYSDGLYSFRTSVTAKDFLLKLRNRRDVKDYYVIKADVSNYVGSIVPELIIPMLEKLWENDPDFLNFLKFLLLRREVIEWDQVTPWEPGGLGGVPLGNHFMNVYLMDLDDFFVPRAPLYCRYSDDLIIFARTKEEAREYLNVFYRTLEEKRLTTNKDKTQLIEPGGEIEILGCVMRDGRLDISEHAKKKIKRKIRIRAQRILKRKKERHMTDDEAGMAMISYCDAIFFGRKGSRQLSWARWIFPVITSTDSLRELDHYVQNAVRYVMCGSFSNKRYRIRYKDLQRLGYQSVLHAYYHFTHANPRE